MSGDETAMAAVAMGTTTLTTGQGLRSAELCPYLVPQRAGDPLGLGIASGDRPPAPPDPDIYDREHENAAYARSMLDADQRKTLDAELESSGYMDIDEVRKIVLENSSKGSLEVGGIDPEVMALIDARINYKIFVAGDNIYTRATLYDTFPFHEFNVQPEAIFVQQEIGIFPARRHANATDLEYVARDVGDESVEFMMIEDLVGLATRKGYVKTRAPLRVVKTKIYIGKERWDDFSLMQRFFRGAARIANAHLAYGGAPSIFAQLARPQLITDDTAARETELRRREDELNLRESEQRIRDADVQAKLNFGIARVEALLARMELPRPDCGGSVAL